ncbi:hypothetical protein [Paenibacillus daejeonensis]|uniref:hypothetical protein n=1 Tax=Paenibacillus daejeonensis TaxID=135193 RepID=UPI0003604EFE|nr:hypothetical protein [Paenibacillus daejeonensis]
MKKQKLPGENISLKTKKSEDPAVMEWINTQTNLMDSIRYLIENEIIQNRIRNLQTVIPSERNISLAMAEQAAGAGEVAAAEPEPVIEDEIDDEDIESWI